MMLRWLREKSCSGSTHVDIVFPNQLISTPDYIRLMPYYPPSSKLSGLLFWYCIFIVLITPEPERMYRIIAL